VAVFPLDSFFSDLAAFSFLAALDASRRDLSHFFSLLSVLGLQDGSPPLGLGVRVEFDEETEVLERVLLVDDVFLRSLLGSKVRLDFLGVDQTTQIGVGEGNSGKSESNLEFRRLRVRSIKFVKLLEGRFGPNDEASEMSSRGELEEVEVMDAAELNTGNVSESTNESVFLVVNDQRSPPLDVTSVPHFTLSGTNMLRVDDFLDVGVGVEGLEDGDGDPGLLDVDEGAIFHDEGDLGDLIDSVSSSHDQRGGGRGGEGGGERISSLVLVHASMPSSIDLGGTEPASSSTHVSESSLTGAMSTTSWDSGNTSDSPTSSPRCG